MYHKNTLCVSVIYTNSPLSSILSKLKLNPALTYPSASCIESLSLSNKKKPQVGNDDDEVDKSRSDSQTSLIEQIAVR